MNWGECKGEKVFERQVNPEEARSLLKMARLRKKDNERREVRDENVSLIIESHWETIKQLSTGLLILEGYKSYSQECLIEFLKEFHEIPEKDIQKMNQVRKLRNDIDYRGKFLDQDYLERNQEQIHNIIHKLEQKLETKLEDDT